MGRYPKAKVHPLQTAGFFSNIGFSWLWELLWVSRVNPWTQEMHYPLPKLDRVENHKPALQKQFEKSKGLFTSIMKVYSGSFFFLIFATLVLRGIVMSTATFTSSALRIISSKVDITIPENFEQMIYFFATIAFLTPVTAIFTEYFRFLANRLSLGIRAAIYSMLQDKIMKFSIMNSNRFSEGYITNLIQVDAPLVADLVSNLFYIIDGSSQFLIGFLFMIQFASIKLTVIMMAIFLTLNIIYLVSYYFKNKVMAKLLAAKDKRMSYFTNVLENIDFVKINGMENEEALKLYKKREVEIKYLKYNAYLEGLVDFAQYFIGYASTWFLMGYMIFFETNPKIDYGYFVGLNSLFDTTRRGLGFIMQTIAFFIQLRVSLNRMNEFLNTKEINQSFVQNTSNAKSNIAISVKNGDFKWKYNSNEEGTGEELEENARPKKKQIGDGTSVAGTNFGQDSLLSEGFNTVSGTGDDEDMGTDFFVRGVNIEIKKGEKVAVIGRSSSGKSSFLYSIMGEMIPMNINGTTEIVRNGRVSYLAQNRWVIGTSIKENICLGKKYDEEMMDKALLASQLAFDIQNLSHGIDTILSDSGDTVSGGQKARIGLARCFYQE